MNRWAPLLLGLAALPGLLAPGCADEGGCTVDADCEQDEQGEQIEICKFDMCVPKSCEGDPETGWRLISNRALRDLVREQVGLTEDDQYLFLRHVRKIKELKAVNLGISGLNGLQCFLSLERLYLDNNSIGNLGPLAGHPALRVLSIGRNNVSNLSPLAEVFTLEELLISDNRVGNLGQLLRVRVDPEDPEKGYRATNLQVINLANNNVSDLMPLIENAGIGDGDQIDLEGNALNCELGCSTDPCGEEQSCSGGCVCHDGGCLTPIQALRARGTFLLTDCDE